MTNLIGKYQISKSNLVSNSTHLVIAQRKKVEGTKPKQYLLLKTPNNTFQYISSLYPSKVGAMVYEIDFSGIKYMLTIDQDNQVANIEMLQNSITVTFTPKL
jgi:hypothetical protein